MYNSHYEMVYNQAVQGIKIKVVKKEDSLVMTEFELQKGTFLPEHLHPSDHSGYLLKGKIRINADGIASEFIQGDSWTINKNICHTTEALEDSVVLEVFNIENEYEEFTESHRLQVAGI
ncbi:MAG: cupin domain-containing protein [Prolixibacteraceae bacterium]|nr:cupin domain-containing protein [Prolixibacteraceae bacterium]